ncbi:MAG: hypothetical protein WCK26_02745 [Candidatus Saccharibacteria bacterium]
MNAQTKVKVVMFYTRSNNAHNRQIVAIMMDGKHWRFSEGKMCDEILVNALPETTLREIEQVAYKKAMTFRHDEGDWIVIQKLLCEFQLALDVLYD